jgi:hypothetical protein
MPDRINWLLVSSADNFEVSRSRGFDIAGMKSRHRKKAQRVSAGDRVIFYLTGIKSIGGIAEATGPYFENSSHIWSSNKPGEEYPFRFPIKPLIIREPGDYILAEDLVPLLEYPKRWPAKNWTLAFQGNVHILSEEDYQVIESHLSQSA